MIRACDCGEGDIKKAKEAGYHTCDALLMNTRKVSKHWALIARSGNFRGKGSNFNELWGVPAETC